MSDSLGFVGLGVMGAPMAGHLLQAGHKVTVWSRSPGKSEPLRERGAEAAPTLEDLARRCDVIFSCVNRSEDVAECVHGCLEGARPGMLFVDHSTIDPATACSLHGELAAQGIGFVDAPVTGGSMGAQKGQLTIFCGGDEEHVNRALPIVKAYAKRAERVGGPGAGQMMKLANQIAVAGTVLGLCECMAFVEKAGLIAGQALDMIGGGAGGSWAFSNYGPKVLARDWSPGFSVKNQRKDFAYCKQAARDLHAEIPGTELVDSLLARLQEAGHGEWTTAALFDVLASRELE